MEEKKLIIIRDRIPLPQMGWGSRFQGPVMQPVMLPNETLRNLLSSRTPVKAMFAVNPDNFDNKILMTLDNYSLTNDELFGGKEVNSTKDVKVDNIVETPEEKDPVEVVEQLNEVTADETKDESTNEADTDKVTEETKVEDTTDETPAEVVEPTVEIIADGTKDESTDTDATEQANEATETNADIADSILEPAAKAEEKSTTNTKPTQNYQSKAERRAALKNAVNQAKGNK